MQEEHPLLDAQQDAFMMDAQVTVPDLMICTGNRGNRANCVSMVEHMRSWGAREC
jgi:hypothetical protein